MANYYIDTEFLEGPQTKKVLGIPVGKTKPTIDLISIGIVAEDGREYYAISKDFNLKEAWNRYQESTAEINEFSSIDGGETYSVKFTDRGYKEARIEADKHREKYGIGYIQSQTKGEKYKEYWLRDNVLKPIYEELICGDGRNRYAFSYSTMKWLLNIHGKTNKQIAEEIKEFVYGFAIIGYDENEQQIETTKRLISNFKEEVNFHAYYADYDWVVFCWLFGKMIDLPDGFPMYCRDLKQLLDEKASNFTRNDFFTAFDFEGKNLPELTFKEKIDHLKLHVAYPKQPNEHNALADARWNKKLHEFINTL